MREYNRVNGASVWLNALLLLLLILGAVGLVARAGHTEMLSRTENAEIVAVIESISEATRDNLHAGDVLTLADGQTLGRIASIDAAPHEESFTAPDGTRRVLPVSGRYDLTLTVRSEGHFGADGFLLGSRMHIAPGQTLSFTTRIIESSMKILKIEKAPY